MDRVARRNGTSPAKREGDRRTPAGIFGFLRTMYGIAASPGVHYAYRRVVWTKSWSAFGAHTVKIVGSGTAGHPRVDIDALIVAR